MNRVTIADVAREAGVSLMTVSRALNNKDGISRETRNHVLDVVHRLGYRPSGIARSLVTRRTGTIGLIVPDVSNPYFSGIAHGVAEVANHRGLSVLLCDTQEESCRELDFLAVLEEKQVDGVIVAAPRHKSEEIIPLMTRHQHLIIVNRMFDQETGFKASGYVINDDMAGGRMLAEHLISRGHRSIGALAGPQNSYGSRQRIRGYQQALASADLVLSPDLIYYCPPYVKGGRESALELLQTHPEITALLCFNDMVAIGALQAGKLLGRKTPEDLSIVGYDDIPMATWVTPALTTCRAPFEEMGRLATKFLIDHIEECAEGCENIVLHPELIIRASAP